MSELKDIIRECVVEQDYMTACQKISANLGQEIAFMKDDPEYCVLAADVFLNMQKKELAFEIITIGLICDSQYYELFLMLADYYYEDNLNQALLCYKQALFLCDNEEDAVIIKDFIQNAIELGAYIRPVSFVVLNKYGEEALEQSIAAINNTVSTDEIEIIVTDESYNAGIKSCSQFNDVFLMDSSICLMDNSFFYLMLDYYSADDIGAIGGLINRFHGIMTEQVVDIDVSDIRNVLDFSRQINSPLLNSFEKKIFLSEKALLINRRALDDVGIFDARFLGAAFEDIDLCVRINMAHYQVLLAYNSFMYCRENDERMSEEELNLEQKNKALLKEKWGCNLGYSSDARSTLIDMIPADKGAPITVLELGCALGSTLNRIKFLWPKADVHGVEYDEAAARIAGSVSNVIQGDVENMQIPYTERQFDFIICADVLEHLRNPEATIRRFIPYLKTDGYFLISLPNVRYYAVSMMLMQYGRFDYADSGILDRTHIKFFTKDTAIEMLQNCGLEVVSLERNYNGNTDDNDFISRIKKVMNVVDADEMKVFQYYLLAKLPK